MSVICIHIHPTKKSYADYLNNPHKSIRNEIPAKEKSTSEKRKHKCSSTHDNLIINDVTAN